MNSEISKSLVADYDSSSEEDEPLYLKPSIENHATPLVSALEMLDQNAESISSSVFTNPYQKAENYEQSVLEKHVKMTTITEPTSNNKKICYKFRKGKCKLGDKCHYLHQNPIHNNDSDRTLCNDEEETDKNVKEKSKKRCGLKDDLIPPKKFMKTFNKHK